MEPKTLEKGNNAEKHNGHLNTRMLGLPSCSHTTWHKMIEDLEVHVSNVAEWSCSRVRDATEQRRDKKKWVASFDGFYLPPL